jgi:transcriptional regulator
MLYQPPHFAVAERNVALELMHRHPLATIVSAGEGNEPTVSHAPLLAMQRGDDLVLLGHLARPNPHWKQWTDASSVLAIFQGGDAYVSPSWYAPGPAVPTWNYAVVHAAGRVTLSHDSDAKERVLKALIDAHDPPYRARWDELDSEWREKMKGAIVAFELAVTRLDVKFKVSQNRSGADRSGVLRALQNGDARARELAEWMQRVMPPS